MILLKNDFWLQHTDFNLADQILIISKNKITSLLNFVKETIKIMPNYLRQRFFSNSATLLYFIETSNI